MSSRFSLTQRSKTESNGKTQSKLSPAPSFYHSSPGLSVNPSASTSKTRNAQTVIGLAKTLVKASVAKATCPPSSFGYTKRYISSLTKSSIPDSLSKSLTTKKKILSKSSPQTSTSDKPARRNTRHSSVDASRKASKENASSKAMHHEGPMQFQEVNYDFYSTPEKPKSSEFEDEELDLETREIVNPPEIKRKKVRPNPAPGKKASNTDNIPVVPVSQPRLKSNLKKPESEIWGEMRTSTAESTVPSSPPTPSLTSISADEMHDSKRDEDQAGIQRDENNNILENTKNSACQKCQNVTFPNTSHNLSANASTVSTVISNDNSSINVTKTKKPLVEDYCDKGNGSNYASKKLDRVKSIEEVQKNIEEEFRDNNNNILDCQRPKNITVQDSPLMPFEIERGSSDQSCDESQQVHCNRQLQKYLAQSYRTRLEMSEMHVVSIKDAQPLEEPPSLTMKPYPEVNDSNSSLSVELDLGGLMMREVERRASHFRDIDTQNSLTNCISASTSYTSASADDDEEFFNADTTSHLEEKYDTQETQTQSVTSQDAATGTENLEEVKRREKLMSLVMRVNAGIDIHTPPEHKKKSVKLRGIMKTSRREGLEIVDSTGTDSDSPKAVSNSPEGVSARRTIPEEIRYPKTFVQVGADYGFPSDISISGIIRNLATLTWTSTDEEAAKTENVQEKSAAYNTSTYDEANDEDSGSNHLIKTAYDVFNAGLKAATDLIGGEGDMEGREDKVCYNGYRIKVRGKHLLLESMHVNCDFNTDSKGIACRSNHSAMSLSQLCRPTMSRAELEQGCEGRRIRIVIRIGGQQDVLEPGNNIPLDQHYVQHSEGKWTLIYGNGENIDDFIEIGCPTGVHPESLAYDLLNGFILVDAP